MRSGSTSVVASAGFSGFDGSGLGFGAVWRSSARWRPPASGLLGVFWTRLGVAPCGGGWLGIGARWWHRWPGGSGASCCLAHRAPGVLRVLPVSVRQSFWGGKGCVCPGLGLG